MNKRKIKKKNPRLRPGQKRKIVIPYSQNQKNSQIHQKKIAETQNKFEEFYFGFH